jgi:hypothetical protein
VVTRLLELGVQIPPGTWMFVTCNLYALLQLEASAMADYSSRGVLPLVSVLLCVITCNNNPVHLQ